MIQEVLRDLVAKMPTFEPWWNPETRRSWLDAFNKILEMIRAGGVIVIEESKLPPFSRCATCGAFGCEQHALAEAQPADTADTDPVPAVVLDPEPDPEPKPEPTPEANPSTTVGAKHPWKGNGRACARCRKIKGPTAFKYGSNICTKCRRAAESAPATDSLDTPLHPKRFNTDRSRAAANAYLKAHPRIQFKGGSEKATWLRNWESGLIEVTA